MHTATLEDVQARLPEYLSDLGPGDELLITQGGRTIARLLPPALPTGVPIVGRGKGKVLTYVDDDEHLRDWSEYLP